MGSKEGKPAFGEARARSSGNILEILLNTFGDYFIAGNFFGSTFVWVFGT